MGTPTLAEIENEKLGISREQGSLISLGPNTLSSQHNPYESTHIQHLGSPNAVDLSFQQGHWPVGGARVIRSSIVYF